MQQLRANLTAGTDTGNVTLPTLADSINAEHEACARAAASALDHAITAGRLLLEAKARCGHGAWLPWLRANVTCSERTAQAYMRVAARHDALDHAKSAAAADLTLRDALALLAAPAAQWEPPAVDPQLIPPDGHLLVADHERVNGTTTCMIIPSTMNDFYVVIMEPAETADGGLLITSARPIAAWGIGVVLDLEHVPRDVAWRAIPAEPWAACSMPEAPQTAASAR